MSTASRSREIRRDIKNASLYLLGLLIVIDYATISQAIDYGAFRRDTLPRGKDRLTAITTRGILKELIIENATRDPTLQVATENMLQYGALLRTEILEQFGKLVYDHYDDFGMSETEALYRIYRETLERRYNIFAIVPSVLEDPDKSATKICSHINQRIRTFLKESSRICMNIKIHDEPNIDRLENSALNVTRRIQNSGEITENYPNGFSLKTVLHHLRAGRLRLTSSLIVGLLCNVQYDNFDDKVRNAERKLVLHLRRETSGSRITKKLERSVLDAPTIGELLRRYLSNVDELHDDEKVANQAAYLSKHVVREIGAVSENIELLGMVYDNGTINLKYLFELVLPNDTVDSDIIEARDYVLRKISNHRFVENLLSTEKYEQTGPDQLLMKIFGQLRDIGYVEDLAKSLYLHAGFWHKSRMIENLNEFLELFDAYENLRNLPNYRHLGSLMDRIRLNLRDSRNATIELLCSRPRECLRMGLEIIANCDSINDETKQAIRSFVDRTSCGCECLRKDSSGEGSLETVDDEDNGENMVTLADTITETHVQLENSVTTESDVIRSNEKDHSDTIESDESSADKSEEITTSPNHQTTKDIAVTNETPERLKETCTGPGCRKDVEINDCTGPDCSASPMDKLKDCEGPDCQENSTLSQCKGHDCPVTSCEDGSCSENPVSEECPDCESSSCEGDDCSKSSAEVNPCQGPDCPKSSAEVNPCQGPNCPKSSAEVNPCQGPDCPKSTELDVTNCSGEACNSTKICEGSDCSIEAEDKCEGDDCTQENTEECEGDCKEKLDGEKLKDSSSNVTSSTECEGPNCSIAQDKMKEQCEGEDCSNGEAERTCEGPDCLIGEDQIKKVCEGPDCPNKKAEKTCEGPDCPIDEEKIKNDCEGEDCSKEETEKICKGPDCSIDEEKMKDDCEGEDCPKKEAETSCEGPDCPIDEEKIKNECEGQDCSHEDAEKSCEGPDCPIDGEKLKDDCEGKDCPTEESVTPLPTSTTIADDELKTFCDNSDPNYHRKLDRLRKMRLIGSQSSKPQSGYEIFNPRFIESANERIKENMKVPAKMSVKTDATEKEITKTQVDDETKSDTENSNKPHLKYKSSNGDLLLKVLEKADIWRSHAGTRNQQVNQETRSNKEIPKKTLPKYKSSNDDLLINVFQNPGFWRSHAGTKDQRLNHGNKNSEISDSQETEVVSKNSADRKTLRKNKTNIWTELGIDKVTNATKEGVNFMKENLTEIPKKLRNRSGGRIVTRTRIFDEENESDEDEDEDGELSFDEENPHGDGSILQPILGKLGKHGLTSHSFDLKSNDRKIRRERKTYDRRETDVDDKNRKFLFDAQSWPDSSYGGDVPIWARREEPMRKPSSKNRGSKVHESPNDDEKNRKFLFDAQSWPDSSYGGDVPIWTRRKKSMRKHPSENTRPKVHPDLLESPEIRQNLSNKKRKIDANSMKSIMTNSIKDRLLKHPRQRLPSDSSKSSRNREIYDTKRKNVEEKNRKSVFAAPLLRLPRKPLRRIASRWRLDVPMRSRTRPHPSRVNVHNPESLVNL